MIWLLLAAVICGGDLAIKHYIEKNKQMNCHEPIMGGRIIITRYHNTGAMLGWMQKQPKFLLGMTIVMSGLVIAAFADSLHHKQSIFVKAGLSLLVGGAASNVYDRLVRHEVTDYFRINIGSKKLARIIFNLGDIAIFLGSLMTVIGETK